MELTLGQTVLKSNLVPVAFVSQQRQDLGLEPLFIGPALLAGPADCRNLGSAASYHSRGEATWPELRSSSEAIATEAAGVPNSMYEEISGWFIVVF